MKQIVGLLFSTLVVMACNNTSESDAPTDSAAGDPARMQPPTEAITDSTKIVNDSVIVPDTALKGGAGTTTDTLHR